MTKKSTVRKRGLSVFYKGEFFPSLSMLAEYLNVSEGTMYRILSVDKRGPIRNKEVSHLIEKNFIGSKCYFVFNKGFFLSKTLPII